MIALNQLANALTGGDPDESVSSRLGNARETGSRFARAACAILETVDFHTAERADHCAVAIEQHRLRLKAALDRAQ